MATRRTVDLGTVGFGLVPNTKALEQSLAQLRKFGKEVERLGQHTDEVVQKQHRKFAGLERTLTSLFARTAATTQRMKEAGVAAPEIDKVNQAYKRLLFTVTKTADQLTKAQLNRGVVGMQSVLSQGNRLAGAREASKFALAFRDLERAAILAVGPLSGIGARLAVLAALFESTGAKMAVFIATMTGLAAGFVLLGVKAIKAAMDMERFDAVLEASTGSATLTGDAYAYVLGLSNKLGQNVRALVEPYAKFTTAARLSNVALSDQQKVFEGAMVAGTAMKLSSERMGLVFLALEQMISKGTISTEELRRQLGDLLPGSIGLAAKAMGVSQQKLLEMIKNGEILAEDLLPKLAEQWQAAFGSAAQSAAQTLQAEMQRVATATFELLKRFDEITQVSEKWRAVVVATREALQFLTANMREVIAGVGALAGAFAGVFVGIAAIRALGAGVAAVVTTMVRWGTAIATVTSSFVALRTAIIALDFAAAATVVGRIGTAFLRLGAAVAGAAAGYLLLRTQQEPLLELSKQWTKETRDWIELQERLGSSHRQTTQQMIVQTAERITAMNFEMATLQAQIAMRRIERHEAMESPFIDPRARIGGGLKYDPKKDPVMIQLEGQLLELKSKRDEFLLFMEQMRNLKLDPIVPPDTEGGTAFQNWVKTIEQSVREYKGLVDQIAAADRGKTAMQQAEGMAKAIEKIADIPDKKRGAIDNLSKQLANAGFVGIGAADAMEQLKSQLAQLFTAIEQRKDELKEIENFPKKLENAGKGIVEMFDAIEARRKAAMAADPDELRQIQELEKHRERLRDFTEVLEKAGLTQAQVTVIADAYDKQLKETQGLERSSKEIKKLRQELEALDNSLGSSQDRSVEKFNDRMRLIAEGATKGGASVEETVRRIDLANADLSRSVTARGTLMGKQLSEVFRDVEREGAKMFATIAITGKFQIQDMLDAITFSIYEFVARMAVIAPTMRALFGQLYDPNAPVNSGIFEGFMRGITGAQVPTGDGMAFAGGMDLSGFDFSGVPGFATGGSFDVGGSGGTDSQFVGFRATPGEHVEVMPPGKGKGVSISINVNNETGVPVQATTSPPRMDGDIVVFDLMLRRLSRDAGARQQLKGMLEVPPH